MGIFNDHVGVRFSLMLWLMLCLIFTIVAPSIVSNWLATGESLATILTAAEPYQQTTYWFLVMTSIIGVISLQTNVQASIAYLFGVYSAGRAFTLSQTLSRLGGLCFILAPVLLSGGFTEMTLFWVLCVLMGCGFSVAFFLNPFSLVHEPEDAIAWTDLNQNENKYAAVEF